MEEAINIESTLKAYKKYEAQLPTLPATDVAVFLSTLTPVLDVDKSIELTSVLIGGVSKKYNGKFDGDKKLASLEHRTLTTGVITPEIASEPEELRSTYLADKLKLKFDIMQHPFEKWLIEWGIVAAAQDLDLAIGTAKVNAAGAEITDAFDSFEEIIKKDIVDGKISAEKKNLVDLGAAITAANAGVKLLAMWRAADKKLRKAAKVEMRISQDDYDAYEDWYANTHDRLPSVDTSGQVYLEGTQKKVVLMPYTEWTPQRVVLTIPGNMVYGTKSLDAMKRILPFESGNPHLYTATGKYNFGLQFRSVHSSVFITNKLY